MKVGRMAAAFGKSIVPHMSGGGLGFLYNIHLVSVLPNAGAHHEFKGLGTQVRFECKTSPLKVVGGKIKVPTGPGLGLEVDEEKVREVLVNLVSNSLDAIEEAKRKGIIEIGLREQDGKIVIAVSDNGIGIPLENLGRIFDRFYIVAKDDLAHQVDRIGLSLPIAKGIVEAHGGRLWVESQVGKGSVFHIDLPKEQAK